MLFEFKSHFNNVDRLNFEGYEKIITTCYD